MSVRLSSGLLLALASAGALNWSYLAQHGEVGKMPPISARRPIRSLRLLFASGRWLVGFLVGVLGWVLYVSALALAPLSLVQAASAGGIGLLALLVWRTTAVTLSRREWSGVGIAVGGLVLLGVSLVGHSASHGHAALLGVVAWIAASLLVAALAATLGASRLAAGSGLGLAAGVLYAAGDVGTKAATNGGLGLAFIPALLACHGLAFSALQIGFQRGSALATAGVATLFTNAIPIVAGLVLYHESLPGGLLGALRLLAFIAVVFAAAALAHPDTSPTTRETDPGRTK